MFMSLEYGIALYENIASTIVLLNYNFNLHLRNNIIKLQSLTHIQLLRDFIIFLNMVQKWIYRRTAATFRKSSRLLFL